MTYNCTWVIGLLMACSVVSQNASAECVIAAEQKLLDPVEVGYCESDAIFVAKAEGKIETVRAFRPEGSERTAHYRIERSTLRVSNSYKGKLPDTVTMITDLYDKSASAYSFERDKEYLVFAKRLAGENEYASASATCSVQPTVQIADASQALEQLEQHRKGRKKVDCKNIRAKDAERSAVSPVR
jgi:hypothetical protein